MYSEKTIKSKKQANQASMFEKRTVVELSENQMTNVDGGTSWMTFGTTSLLTTALKLQ